MRGLFVRPSISKMLPLAFPHDICEDSYARTGPTALRVLRIFAKGG